jgi:hypothetical protein
MPQNDFSLGAFLRTINILPQWHKQGVNMNNDKEWHRPKKPYVVTPDRSQQGYGSQPYDKKPYDKKSKPKPVIIPAKNNANNKVLHECVRANGLVKITINNLLSSDKELSATYEGKIKGFDDFTILLETFNGSFLINKNAIAVVEFLNELPNP